MFEQNSFAEWQPAKFYCFFCPRHALLLRNAGRPRNNIARSRNKRTKAPQQKHVLLRGFFYCANEAINAIDFRGRPWHCRMRRPGDDPPAKHRESNMFGTFTYHCSKTGLDTETDFDSLPLATQTYYMRRGAREYYDNYHASETKKKWGADTDGLVGAVTELVAEAHARAQVGDVPTERGTRARPQSAVQQLANRLAAAGFTAMTDQELAIVIESLARAREAA